MHPSHPTSLLIAALVMLRRPCVRNKATARLLLERAAEYADLTPAEREACLNLASDLDIEHPGLIAAYPVRSAARPVPGAKSPQHRKPIPGPFLVPNTKGVPA